MNSNKHFYFVLLGIVLFVAIVVGFRGQRSSSAVDPYAYQAVFLSNGQIYFGKLSHFRSRSPLLTDVYYLRQNPPVQQSTDQSQQQAQLSLVKLGDEIHGPQDAMYFNRDQILFWENLKNNSRVVQAISQQKAQGDDGDNHEPGEDDEE